MFFQILKGSFSRGGRKKTLAVITVFFAACLITTLMNLSVDVGDKMAYELKSYGANIHVFSKSENLALEIDGTNYNPLHGQTFLDETELPQIKNIFWSNNIIGFAPFLTIPVSLDVSREDPGGKPQTADIIGTYFEKHVSIEDEADFYTGVKHVYPYWKVKGVWPNDESDDEALVGTSLSNLRHWKTGDKIRIRINQKTMSAHTFTIVGILETGSVEDRSIVVPLSVVQKLAQLPDQIHSLSVSALSVPEDQLSRKARRNPEALDSAEYDRWYCTAYVSSISHQIEEVISNASVRPVWQVVEGEGAIVNKIQLLMLVITLAAFIASTLGISSLMSSTIMERSKEIGLMKALGAAEWEVYGLFLSEAVIVGMLGGLLGWLAGAGVSQIVAWSVFGSTIALSWIVVPVIVVISVLITLVGSFIPSRLITRLYPAEVLHGR
jgi:putative ABC transport system permease protein